MGLTPKEYNEFIVYWAPIMQNNAYNIISFQGDTYQDKYPLTVTDADGNTPDSMLRVMMAWKASDKFIDIPKQEIKPFARKGFTVIEWGGYEAE